MSAPSDTSSDSVLTALIDESVWAILTAADAEPRTVCELSERSGIAESTIYRKVSMLVDAELLDEEVRVDDDGNPSEYRLNPTTIEIDFAEPGFDVQWSTDHPEKAQEGDEMGIPVATERERFTANSG